MQISHSISSILKGLGIMLIILHNFTHWLPNAIIENEYNFDIQRISEYWRQIQSGAPFLGLNFLSHYGHYGICIFLFISGYGLVKKYEQSDTPMPHAFRFIWLHAVKLWRLMIPAIVLLVLGKYYSSGEFRHDPMAIVSMLTFISNFQFNIDLLAGPWWYFSLIMQFYVFYRLVLYKNQSLFLILSIVIGSILLQLVAYITDYHMCLAESSRPLLDYVRLNFIGHLLPFFLGLVWARNERQIDVPNWLVFVVNIVLLILSSLNVGLWLISPIFAILALLSLSRILSDLSFVSRILVWIGGLSPFIFASHPIVRAFFFPKAEAAFTEHATIKVYLFIVLYVVSSCCLAWVLRSLDRWLGKKLSIAR